MDEETLKMQIRSAQSEQDRINPFINQFLGEKITSARDHNVDSKKEVLWDLVSKLLGLFEDSNLNFDHDFLKMAPEITKKGFELLFTCYDKGEKRMEHLLQQEVYKKEVRITSGRKLRNVNVYKYENLKESWIKKKKRRSQMLNPADHDGPQILDSIGESSSSNNNTNNFSFSPNILDTNKRNFTDLDYQNEEGLERFKRHRRATTPQEHMILDPLVQMYNDPPEELIKDAEEKTGWGHQRLIKYIYNHRKSRKGKQQK